MDDLQYASKSADGFSVATDTESSPHFYNNVLNWMTIIAPSAKMS